MKRERCYAEIGRPGSYHGCRRPATYRVIRYLQLDQVRPAVLLYCTRHVDRAASKPDCRAVARLGV